MNDNVHKMPPVPPFVKFVAAAVPMVFDDSLSYYEALCALWKYISGMTDVINNNATLEEEYIAKFDELKEFVDHYFDNLDVQEEINNKLDEMVEDGTLQDLVDNYLDTLTRKVQYIFPKNWDGLSGDANLIQGYGKTILIDTYRASNKSDLYQMLSDYNISHIDYLILTHYHDDHIGNAVSLINDGYVDSTSYVYIPPDCQQIIDSVELTSYKNAIIAALTSHNVPYGIPVEESELTIDDEFSIEFYNTDSATLSTFVNYNNCCTLCKVKHLDKISYYTADCLGSALNRAYENGFVNSHVDLYKIEHHGIERTNNFFKVLNSVRPTYAYQPAFIQGTDTNLYCNGNTVAFFKSIGTHVYTSYFNTDYIVFESFNNTFNIIQGKESAEVSNNNQVDGYINAVYVDASTTDLVQDGTQNHPYKDLPQAVGNSTKLISGKVHIILAEGDYCEGNIDPASSANYLMANNVDLFIEKLDTADIDNVIINNSCHFNNSVVKFANVTFKNNSSFKNNLVIQDTILTIDGCKFDGSEYTTDEGATGIYSTHSKIDITNTTANNYGIFLSSHRDTSSVTGSTFDTITTVVQNRAGLSFRNNNTYTDVTNKFYDSDSALSYPNWKTLYDGTNVTSGDITLNQKVTDFNKLMIVTGSVGSGSLYTSVIYSFFPNKFENGKTYSIKNYDGRLTLYIYSSGGKITVTPLDGTTNGIRKIFAAYEDLD